ncbi:MAG: hypothetical protein JWM68_1930, partial [Verrucomicrobiales bacterium]|nr:hypothetical protein [Verrucomicrobiales bacterium]
GESFGQHRSHFLFGRKIPKQHRPHFLEKGTFPKQHRYLFLENASKTKLQSSVLQPFTVLSSFLRDKTRGFHDSSSSLVFPIGGCNLRLILERRRIAPGASWGRKVRTPQSTMPRNFRKEDTRGRNVLKRFDGKCHREHTAEGFALPETGECGLVRVKRWCKRPPRDK